MPAAGQDTGGDILADLAGFDGFGRATRVETVEGIPYFVNEYWTARQRRGHALHEVSYRACFKAELPRFFIDRLTAPGDVVFDPFMGRGTTPLEAALTGRRAWGSDINPLSVLLTRPRLGAVRQDEVAEALAGIDWDAGEITNDDLLAFYHPATLRRIEALRRWLGATGHPAADWIRMVALSRLSGHSPGFFSGRSMPPNQAVSVAAQRRINERLGQDPPERDVAALILRKSASLLRDGPPPEAAQHRLATAPAEATGLPGASVDLVVTSPPFLDVVQYAADNWLRCWFAGIDPGSVAIASHRDPGAWSAMVARVLRELARITRPGGHIAFEVGEVRGGRVLLERLVWQAADGLPLHRLGVMVNAQDFTKTANCWGVANGRMGTNTNRIVLLRRA